jgi:hypothetical protein
MANTRLIAARVQQVDPARAHAKASLLTKLSLVLRAAGLAAAGGPLGPLGPVPAPPARGGRDSGYSLSARNQNAV